MTEICVDVSAHQRQVLEDSTSAEIVFQGGVGCGKTRIGALWSTLRALSSPSGVDGMAVSCTYKQQISTVVPTLLTVLEQLAITYTYNSSDKALLIGPRKQRLWMRSAEDPDNLAGPNLSWAWLDEAALMHTPSGKRSAYERVSQRLRDSRARRQLLMTTTPEGTRTWVAARIKAANEWATTFPGRPCPIRVVQAPTFSNPWLPDDYRERLEETYRGDEDGWRNYVEGIAVDSRGNVYTALKQSHFVKANPVDARRLQLIVGWDFNVGTMATCLCTWDERQQVLHVFGEVVSHDVQTDVHAVRVVEALKKASGVTLVMNEGRRQLFDGMRRPVNSYIDASGAKTTTNASTTDKRMVMVSGFNIRSNEANPLVRDRVASVQLALRKDRLLIDDKAAPHFARALREHAYDKNGAPQKDFPSRKDELDHFSDALGYVVHGLLPAGTARSLSSSLAPQIPRNAQEILSQMMGHNQNY